MRDYPPRVQIASGDLATVYERRTNELILQLDSATAAVVSEVLTRFGLQIVEYPELRSASALAPTMKWVRVPEGAGEDLPGFARRLLSEENLPSRITMAAPVYFAEGRGPASAIAPIPGKVLVRFRDDKSPSDFGPRNQLVEAQESPHLHPFRSFLVGDANTSSPSTKLSRRRGDASVQSGEPSAAFEVQTKLSELPEVAVVELDWLIFYSAMLTPSDTYWAKQWGMKRIKMSAAWKLQTGAAGLIIGLPDSGVDLTHPDLLLTDPATHFNAAEAETGPGPYNAGPDPTSAGAAHGTLVAGLAAAALDNARGVAGVAGGCPILPARVLPNPTASRFAAAINWCVTQGARVINMSWWAPPSGVIGSAIDNAWAAHVVLCAAAGNNPPATSLVFPATHPRCIAVGAADRINRRKSLASPDGEQWESLFGPGLAVCAPGVRLWSTDIQGNGGLNDNGGGAKPWQGVNYPSCGDANGDYFALWGGTSGATPHVSGLAALLMLKYPVLSNQQVRDIIEKTCTKISPAVYAYSNVAGHPNGTWHSEVGYGLINAIAALKCAARMVR